jgi:uncharacterized protein (DUF1697 family)
MKYIAFLRGINVGGKNKIKMENLREVFGSLGFENVKTYINSGNVIFETDENIVANNSFAGQFENEKDLHVFFLDEELPEDKRELLLSNNNENEQFAVRDREIFCLLRIGVLDSLMGKDYIGKKLKVSATARNWRTVNKIAEL